MSSPARKRWRQWHGWAGWLLGAWLALLGLSGSLLVFYPTLEAAWHPALRWQTADGCVREWQPVLDALRAAEPDRHGPWRIELAEGGCAMVHARYLQPAESAGAHFRPLVLTLHPQQLRPVARFFWGDSLMTWLYDLHFSLLLGAGGLIAVGGVGLAALLISGAGLRLWWPTTAAQWRQAWRAKAGAARQRRTWDQHRLVGLYSLPLMAVLAFTGVVLAWPQWVNPVVAWLSPPLTLAQVPAEPLGDDAPSISLDSALAAARAALPGATPRWVDTPDGPRGAFRVRLGWPEEPSQRFPKSWVRIDPHSGTVLALRDARQQGAGDTFLAWMHPLHNGEAFGLMGRWLALLGGLVWPWLAWTGWRRWRDRRVAQRSRKP